jgi:chaperonin cofactor prefoldin
MPKEEIRDEEMIAAETKSDKFEIRIGRLEKAKDNFNERLEKVEWKINYLTDLWVNYMENK